MTTEKKETLMERRCQGQKADGSDCRIPHLPDSKFCHHHDPRPKYQEIRSRRSVQGHKSMVQSKSREEGSGIDPRLEALLAGDQFDKATLGKMTYLITANLLQNKLSAKQAEVASKLIAQQMKLLGIGEDDGEGLSEADLEGLPKGLRKMMGQ